MKKKLNSDEGQENEFFMDLFNQGNLIKRRNNKIYIFGLIDEKVAFNTISFLHEIYDDLEDYRAGKIELDYTEIEIHLNSEGGIVYDSLALYDTISKIEKRYNVKIYCTGKIMSAAFLILSAGTKGMKYAGKNTTFMLHQVQTQTMGSTSEAENEIKESRRLQNQYIDIVSKNSKLPKNELKKIIHFGKNSYMTAQEAVKMGFIDKIF